MKSKKTYIFIIIILLLGSIIVYLLKENHNLKESGNNYENNKVIKHENMISMMLETEAKSGNYEMTTASGWPTDGYMFNTELSKCENGGELSWDDENKRVLMSGNVSDKCYVYFDKVITLADYVKSLYTGTQGDNNIYYHNGTITSDDGTIIDAKDNSYRYAGANPNNFLCFGSDATPCPTDNLYRIIGVFDENVKLIKYDYADSNLLGTDGDYQGQYANDSSYYKGSNYENIAAYYWNNTTGKNTWSESLLNKTNLNTNFITNIGEEWAKKIATTTWKVGGNTWANVGSKTPTAAYQNEIVSPVTTNTTDNATEYSAKIGLMYVSDYGFAAEPSAWTLTMTNYNNTIATSTNWMYMGLYEWTISRYANNRSRAHIVSYTGEVSHYILTGNNFGLRPSFLLLSSVTYDSGMGVSSDPIRIN